MGNRVQRYQPVGGVLKFYSSAKSQLENFGLEADNLYAPDTINKDDLRITIKGSRFANFLQWYETGRDRETCPWREFHEELIHPGYLDGSIFPHTSFNFLRRHTTGVNISPHTGTPECLIAEIHELLPSPAQITALKSLQENPFTSQILWADADKIRRKGIVCKSETKAQTINDNAEWIL